MERKDTHVAAPAAKETAGSKPISSWLLRDPPLQFPSSPVSQGLTTRHNPTHQGVATVDHQKKDTGEEFKTFDLVDVNSGLW